MINSLPFLIIALVFVIMYYLKKINLKIYIFLYSIAIITMLVSAFVYKENKNISLFMALLGAYFLYKRIKDNNQPSSD